MKSPTPQPDSPEIEALARQLHVWYLEATKKLNPESYNPNAQKAYDDMTEEQKFIDRFIAARITEWLRSKEYSQGRNDTISEAEQNLREAFNA